MYSFLALLNTLISIYTWIVIGSVIFSWLISFGIINQHSQAVRVIGDFLHRATEPVLGPIRKILPNLGALDFSPVVLILLLVFLQNLIAEYGPRLMM